MAAMDADLNGAVNLRDVMLLQSIYFGRQRFITMPSITTVSVQGIGYREEKGQGKGE